VIMVAEISIREQKSRFDLIETASKVTQGKSKW
jgi:hypothetical protein